MAPLGHACTHWMSAAHSELARQVFIWDEQLVKRHFSQGESGVVEGQLAAQCVAVQSLMRKASEIPLWSCAFRHACSHASVGGCGHAWTHCTMLRQAGSPAQVQY